MKTLHAVLFVAALLSGCSTLSIPLLPVTEISRSEVDTAHAVRNRLCLKCDAPLTTVSDTLILRYPVDSQPRYLALRIYGIPPSTRPKPLCINLAAATSLTDDGNRLARYRYQNTVSTLYDKYGHTLIVLQLPEGIATPYLRLSFSDANVNCVTFGDPFIPGMHELEVDEAAYLNPDGEPMGDCICYGYFSKMPTKASTATNEPAASGSI